jgi:hypothetical protein
MIGVEFEKQFSPAKFLTYSLKRQVEWSGHAYFFWSSVDRPRPVGWTDGEGCAGVGVKMRALLGRSIEKDGIWINMSASLADKKGRTAIRACDRDSVGNIEPSYRPTGCTG